MPIFTWKDCLFYGHMSQYQDATVVTINTQGVYEIIDGFAENISRAMTFQNTQEFKIEKAGKYKIDWSTSFTDGNIKTFCGAIMINGTEDLTTAAIRVLGASDAGNFGGTGIIDLAIDDLVQVGIANNTDTSNITIEASNLTITFLEK